MARTGYIVLKTLVDAREGISRALSRGDVSCALSNIQCLWAFCESSEELCRHLDGILLQARGQLSPEACSQLRLGIKQAKREYHRCTRAPKERLLADAFA